LSRLGLFNNGLTTFALLKISIHLTLLFNVRPQQPWPLLRPKQTPFASEVAAQLMQPCYTKFPMSQPTPINTIRTSAITSSGFLARMSQCNMQQCSTPYTPVSASALRLLHQAFVSVDIARLCGQTS
jgi:hypothetical protein